MCPTTSQSKSAKRRGEEQTSGKISSVQLSSTLNQVKWCSVASISQPVNQSISNSSVCVCLVHCSQLNTPKLSNRLGWKWDTNRAAAAAALLHFGENKRARVTPKMRWGEPRHRQSKKCSNKTDQWSAARHGLNCCCWRSNRGGSPFTNNIIKSAFMIQCTKVWALLLLLELLYSSTLGEHTIERGDEEEGEEEEEGDGQRTEEKMTRALEEKKQQQIVKTGCRLKTSCFRENRAQRKVCWRVDGKVNDSFGTFLGDVSAGTCFFFKNKSRKSERATTKTLGFSNLLYHPQSLGTLTVVNCWFGEHYLLVAWR